MKDNTRNKTLSVNIFREKNINILLRKLAKYVFNRLDNVLISFFSLLPVKKNYIVLESEGDFWDNARAFYEYLIDNSYNNKYKIIWIVHDPKIYPREKNVIFASRHSLGINLKADYYIARSSCFLFTHPYWLKKWRSDQTVINMTHSSMMLKAGGKNNLSNRYDYMMCASKSVKEVKMKALSCKENQVIILGAPRIDLLYKKTKSIKKIIPNYNGEKFILSMSTFKQAKGWKDSDIVDKYSLNVIKTQKEINALNEFLKINKLYLIIKIHHLQDTSCINLDQLDRIIYLQDGDLQEKDIQLYELLGEADALLTDYSSVFYDYLLVERPIGFLIADIEDYSRGFCVDNAKEEMVGDKIKNINQLYDFIVSVNKSIDLYKSERKRIKDRVHLYQDEKNCERLLEWLIKEEIII